MIWNVLLAGGDRRALYLSRLLRAGGFQVWTMGLEEDDQKTARPERADALLLPYPWAARDDAVPTLTGLSIHPEDVLRRVRPGTLTIAGSGLEPDEPNVRRLGLSLCDYREAPGFEERNAALSAEGALAYAMRETEESLDGMNVLMTGYGLFGRKTARLFAALGARTTVLARREEQRRLARSDGMRAAPLEAFSALAGEAAMVLNTVPARVLGEEQLSSLPGNCVLMELASAPGGFDPAQARRLGLRQKALPGLPGLYAPQAAARALEAACRYLFDRMDAEEESK